MRLAEINPIMFNVAVNKTAKESLTPFSFGQRDVKCYELERIGSSYGTIILNGKKHRLNENDVFLRKPGQIVEGIMPYRFQYITFEVTNESTEIYDFLNSLPDKVNLSNKPQVKVMFDEIQGLFLSERETAPLLIKARILELLAILSEQNTQIGYTHHMRCALRFIEENYQYDISAEDIAGQLDISVRYLFKLFKEATSDTPIAYLGHIRLDKSKSLLLDTALPVTEIATQCGFRSSSYFDYAFKKQTGLSPGGFRKKYILSK